MAGPSLRSAQTIPNAPSRPTTRPRPQQHTAAAATAAPAENNEQQVNQQAESQDIEHVQGEEGNVNHQQLDNPVQEAEIRLRSPTEAQHDFYRQLGEFITNVKADYPQLTFNAEEILHVFQSQGLLIVSDQYLVNDKSVTDNDVNSDVLEFVQKHLSDLDKIVTLCTGIAQGTLSVDKFVGKQLADLATVVQDMNCYKFNPFPRTSFIPKDFGEFAVQSVSNDALDLKTRGLTQKYHEFTHVYQISSWLFDIGCELLKNILVPSLPQQQCTSLALIAQSAWTQFQVSAKRLVQIIQLSSADPAKRQLAQAKYKVKSSALLLDKDAQEIEDKAAQIAAKQVAERAKNTRGSSSYSNNFRNNQYNRGRGRTFQRYNPYQNLHQNSYGYSNNFQNYRGRFNSNQRGGFTPNNSFFQGQGQQNNRQQGQTQDSHKG